MKTTSPGISAEHNLGFATAGAGQGTFIADNPGNSGGAAPNRIEPISFSQGIWRCHPPPPLPRGSSRPASDAP